MPSATDRIATSSSSTTQPSGDIVGRLGVLLRKITNPQPNVAVVRLSGVISERERMKQRTLSLEDMNDDLEKAFKTKRLKAVITVINSPGGSPAQSELIAKRIRMLSEEKNVPVFAVVEDVAASGGYWLACAADEIYAAENAVIGSVGVIASLFGFVGTMEKLGVERRVYTEGKNKSVLDMFQPEKPEDVQILKGIMHDMHTTFKNFIHQRRGSKLRADDDTLFNGEFWLAGKSLEYGLIDGIDTLHGLVQRKFGDKVTIRKIEHSKGLLKRLIGSESRFSTQGLAQEFVESVMAAVEERAWWGRVGK